MGERGFTNEEILKLYNELCEIFADEAGDESDARIETIAKKSSTDKVVRAMPLNSWQKFEAKMKGRCANDVDMQASYQIVKNIFFSEEMHRWNEFEKIMGGRGLTKAEIFELYNEFREMFTEGVGDKLD